MKRRRQELSIMNVMFCLIVILIHIMAYPVAKFSPGTAKYTFFMIPWRLFSIVVQGFIFLSGVKLFLTKKDKMSYGSYLKSRAKSILGPYVFCCIIYCTFYIFFYGYIITLDYFLNGLIFGTLSVHFYFIPLLLQFDILLPFWKKLVYNYSPLITVPVFLIASSYFESNMIAIVGIFTKDTIPVFNDRIFTTYMFFWIAGIYVGRYYDEFCNILKKSFRFLAVFFGVMLVICAVSSYFAYNEILVIPGMNTIHYFYAVSAIIFLFALSLKIPEGITDRIPLFNLIDNQSYHIYLWHMLVILASDYLVRHLGLAMQSLAFIFRVFFVYTFTIIGIIMLKKLRDKVYPVPVPLSSAPKAVEYYKVQYKKRADR